jgi:hypothetical protein
MAFAALSRKNALMVEPTGEHAERVHHIRLAAT